jgi:hypothetical protein
LPDERNAETPSLNAVSTEGSGTLSPADARRCAQLMHQLIEYFTPVLFTPATTSHMACTDVFADTWMTLVIQPALECDGVYKPLEMLQMMMEVDWVKEGLCETCLHDKKVEWTAEQVTVWSKLDRWLGLSGSQEC